MGSSSLPPPHFVLFPFMSQGHIIPLLHLARLLHHRYSATITFATTPANAAPIRAVLNDVPITILQLPFPQNIPGIRSGIENTHNLPSMTSFLPFAKSTKILQKPFEQALENLQPPVSCIISDAFLGWTVDSANKFRVPRFVFFGMGMFASTMYQKLGRERPHAHTKSLDEPFSMPGFENIELTRNDFEPPYNEIEPAGEYVEFMHGNLMAVARSYGLIVNSFYELESSYVDCWNKTIGPKAFCIGPLCLAGAATAKCSEVDKFLDEKLAEGQRVLYVAFGTQTEVSGEQLTAIAVGIEKSEVNFLWVLKQKNGSDFMRNFIERTKDRGMVVEGWVDQVRILNHGGVGGFLSHCGWNSVIESVAAGVPIVALPFMAEQHMNARFVVDVAGIGVRAMPAGRVSVRGFVEAAEVEKAVREVMGSWEKGAAARKKAEEFGTTARGAMEGGGSSTRTLGKLIEEVGRYGINEDVH